MLWISALAGAALLGALLAKSLIPEAAAMAAGALAMLTGLFLGILGKGRSVLLGLRARAKRDHLFPEPIVLPKGRFPWQVSSDLSQMTTMLLDRVVGLGKENDRLKVNLKRYAGDLVSQDSHQKKSTELGGLYRDVTILFTDIRGYTSLSENIHPEQTVQILNEFYSETEEIILKYKGHVNKFIGDAILSFFYKTSDLETKHLNDGEQACCAALEIAQHFEMLKSRWKEKMGLTHPIGIGCGIASGKVVVGNIGTAHRREFGIIGDAVNLSARLCGMAGDSHVLVSDKTYPKIQFTIGSIELPPATIKGKSEPQKIYRLTLMKDSIQAKKR